VYIFNPLKFNGFLYVSAPLTYFACIFQLDVSPFATNEIILPPASFIRLSTYILAFSLHRQAYPSRDVNTEVTGT
jgi:hypothetical protein